MSKKIITVFGATGLQGSSVLRALLNKGSYHVRAITRNANTDKAKKLIGLNDCSIVEADLDNVNSLEAAVKDSYGVFLVTDFAAHFAKKEVQQGINVIDVALKFGVKHFVFSGLENVESVVHKPCYHFDFKAEIENYGLKNQDKFIFTSVRLPCYFENFGNIFLYKLKANEFLVNVPIDDKPMYSMSVDDIGECVLSVFENPDEYKSKLLDLAGDKLTCSQYVDILNKHLQPNKFIDSKMTIEKFSSLGFPGAEELGVMFEYYQTGKMHRDINLAKKLNKNLKNFEEWVVKNKDSLLNSIN